MMHHPAAHHRRLPSGAGGGKVHCLVQPVPPLGAQRRQRPEVLHRAVGQCTQRQKGRIGRSHPFLLQPPAQSQRRHAVGLVLVILPLVQLIKGRLRNAPGQSQPLSPAPLHPGAELQGLRQQGALLRREQQVGHEIFKHGPRPAGKAKPAVLAGHHPAQPLPVPHRHLSPGHRQKTGLPGLAGQQIIAAVGKGVLLRVPADIEQLPFRVIQRAKSHLFRQFCRSLCKLRLFQLLQAGLQRQQRAAQVPAVHGGDIPGEQGLRRLRVVPVVQVPLPFFQLFYRVKLMGDQLQRPLPAGELQITRRQTGQQGQSDVGG